MKTKHDQLLLMLCFHVHLEIIFYFEFGNTNKTLECKSCENFFSLNELFWGVTLLRFMADNLNKPLEDEADACDDEHVETRPREELELLGFCFNINIFDYLQRLCWPFWNIFEISPFSGQSSRSCTVLCLGWVILILHSRESSGFKYFVKMVNNCKMEKLKYAGNDVTIVSIAHEDEHIEAHKISLRKRSNCEIWHSADDSGMLLQIQACCYRFRHAATDSGILLQIQACCYRFRHLATGSGILLQIQ